MRGRLAFTVAIVALSCGAPKPMAPPAPPPPPPVDDNLLALAPAAYSQVARIDLAALRASPLWVLSELTMTDQTFAALRSAGGAEDPILGIDEILVSGGDPSASGIDELLVVAKGRLDAEALAAALRAKLPATNAPPGAPPALEAAALTKRTIAIGTPAAVSAASALARREGPSMLDDEAFADLEIDAGAVAVYRFRHRGEALALDRLRAGPFKGFDWSRRATEASGVMKIGSGLSMMVEFVLDDPKVAARARRDLSRTIRRFAGNTIVRLLGVGQLLGRIVIGGENERVLVNVVLNEADVAQLQALADRLAQIRELMADDDEEDDEPIELDPPMLEHPDRTLGAERRAD